MKTLLLSASLLFPLLTLGQSPSLTKSLRRYSATLPGEFSQISTERKELLHQIGDYVVTQRQAGRPAKLLYVCTHNSRRSQMGQLWALAAANYYGVGEIQTYSGGLETTAFHPNAVKALRQAGFMLAGHGQPQNPTYEAHLGKGMPQVLMYSKKYDDAQNPHEEFVAIMVCSEADGSCPIVPGAEERVSLPYDDPRYYDGTDAEAAQYAATCRLIARETFYLFDYIKSQQIVAQEENR
ncbi:arsenate reductase [Catalinimonas alkaloidigena]|uniref:Arsenate reductase n=1 Tax=Catalinimonas alkaloidigena TaxID=1075417 RepID=A0A1G9TI91_9BACT|nr:protein-tyrosine-phosphatase [Catalinimonas alkaloidigena]SDM47373.1 arsenate reductase [Catalinimonas alkaloidigena]